MPDPTKSDTLRGVTADTSRSMNDKETALQRGRECIEESEAAGCGAPARLRRAFRRRLHPGRIRAIRISSSVRQNSVLRTSCAVPDARNISLRAMSRRCEEGLQSCTPFGAENDMLSVTLNNSVGCSVVPADRISCRMRAGWEQQRSFRDRKTKPVQWRLVRRATRARCVAFQSGRRWASRLSTPSKQARQVKIMERDTNRGQQFAGLFSEQKNARQNPAVLQNFEKRVAALS